MWTTCDKLEDLYRLVTPARCLAPPEFSGCLGWLGCDTLTSRRILRGIMASTEFRIPALAECLNLASQVADNTSLKANRILRCIYYEKYLILRLLQYFLRFAITRKSG